MRGNIMELVKGTHLNSLTHKYDKSRPRRMLSLDGGGILGVITLEILKKLELELAKRLNAGPDFRLGDYFDYIAGTSTGAIIATGLSIGMSVDELLNFYEESGKLMFSKAPILSRLRAKHLSKPLSEMLQEVLQDRTVGSTDLRCLLLVIAQNATTNSTWPISNNPHAKYNQDSHPFDNKRIPLWQLVRASTAAPTFFLPEKLKLNNKPPHTPFYFVDGGVTPYNNPAFKLFEMATAPEYKVEWEATEDRLLIVSVGTGTGPTGDPKMGKKGRPLFRTAKLTPSEMMSAMSMNQDVNCRTVGRCVFGHHIDNEVGDMVFKPETISHRKFTYARYDPQVGPEGIKNLGLEGEVSPSHLKSMNKPQYIVPMRLVGKTYAQNNVDLRAFSGFLDTH